MYPKVSITYDILAEALKYLDQLNVFERLQDGPTQFGLLGGHVSRLQLPLLEYINYTTPDEQSKWIFTLGTPNTKYVWKLGDRCHQNGFWNMAMTSEKRRPFIFQT